MRNRVQGKGKFDIERAKMHGKGEFDIEGETKGACGNEGAVCEVVDEIKNESEDIAVSTEIRASVRVTAKAQFRQGPSRDRLQS